MLIMENVIPEIYRGCADTYNWPHNGRNLDYSYDGCRYQEYGGWENTKVNAPDVKWHSFQDMLQMI